MLRDVTWEASAGNSVAEPLDRAPHAQRRVDGHVDGGRDAAGDGVLGDLDIAARADAARPRNFATGLRMCDRPPSNGQSPRGWHGLTMTVS